MQIPVRVVRRETHKALQIILAEHPYRIYWIPKSQLREAFRAGDRDIVINVPDWIVQQWNQPTEEN
jgi:hypothetical protein